MSSLTTRCENHVCWLILDDPDGGNVLTQSLVADLTAVIQEKFDDDDCRAIAIRGQAGVFCNGLDLRTLAAARHGGSGIVRMTSTFDEYVELLVQIRWAPKPVVAVVEGSVLGAGVGLVAATDYVIAGRTASFILTETLFGLVPHPSLPFLRDRIGLTAARAMGLSAREVGAQEAFHLGLVDDYADHDDIDAQVDATFQRLMRASPDAQAQLKAYAEQLRDLSLAQACDVAKEHFREWVGDHNNLRVIVDYHRDGRIPPWFASYGAEETAD